MNNVTDIIITPSSLVSLHVQFHNQLRHLILSGQWQGGSRLPSESEFARHLHISRSTIRLALQQAEIEGLIERFSGRGTFVADQAARLHTRRLVAFIAHQFDSDGLLNILKGAESEARARGYQIILHTTRNRQEEIETLHRLKAQNLLGVLIWSDASASQPDPQNAVDYRIAGLPMVMIDRTIYGIEADFVTSDHYQGAAMMMHHLIELGHERVAFLSNQHTCLIAVQERYRAYCDVLRKHGIAPLPAWQMSAPDSEYGAKEALRVSSHPRNPDVERIREYLNTTQPPPTAIFALHDYLAIMVMRAMKLIGIDVPHALSVAGFDDADIAAYLDVPLTTVAQDHFSVGKQAASRLFDRLEGYNGPAVYDRIPTQLRIRTSTAIPQPV